MDLRRGQGTGSVTAPGDADNQEPPDSSTLRKDARENRQRGDRVHESAES